jgi:hypothetical protein
MFYKKDCKTYICKRDNLFKASNFQEIMGFIDLGVILTAGYWGYSNARGMPLDKNLELAIKYGPAVILGVFKATKGAIRSKKGESKFNNPVIGGAVEGVGGVAAGALEVLIGYGLGYTIAQIGK